MSEMLLHAPSPPIAIVGDPVSAERKWANHTILHKLLASGAVDGLATVPA